jgi:hypothetical protein
MRRDVNKAQDSSYYSDLILNRATALTNGDLDCAHPSTLSCGGIFVPRPKQLQPGNPLYHILNTPNDHRPVKVVSALITSNILDDLLGRDRLN